MIRAENICKQFGDQEVLRNISLVFEPGKAFPVGTEFRAAVVEIREDGKINL